MPALTVRLLGALDVRSDDGHAERPSAVKSQELFCYLLLHPGRFLRRDVLSGLLWPDLDPHRCRKNLRQALWQLHSAIGRTAYDMLEISADTIAVRPAADIRLDVTEFRNAFEGIGADELSAASAAEVDRAVRLYQGDLLEDFGFDWCLVEREWLRSTYLMLLDRLMLHCEAVREYDRGVDYGQLILRHDRAREYTHRRLMYLHYLRGDRTGALRQYARCVLALEQELAVTPAASTVRLCEQIRGDNEVDPLSGSLSPRSSAPAWRALNDDLRGMLRSLTELQRQVRAEILARQSLPSSRSGPRASVPAAPAMPPLDTG